jgi:serine/alanine adding enzyme
VPKVINTSPHLQIANALDETTWRQFVHDHPQGNVFHTPEMFQVLSRAKGHQPRLWAAANAQGQVLALLLPVLVTLTRGLPRRLTARAIAYGSVLHEPGPAGEEALMILLRAYTQAASRQALFTELRHLSDMSAVQPVLTQCGFTYEDHLNYLIDLNRAPDAIMQSIGARTRKHIRQGLRKGEVIVEQIDRRDLLHPWYALIRQSYAAAQVPVPDLSLFEAAFDVLRPKGMAQFWLARAGEAHVAASAELPYKDTLYGWYSGMDRRYAGLLPGELLMWHVLKWGAENGYKVYDFGGAGKPAEEYGVRNFKAKFGGQLVCFGRSICIHAPRLLRLSTWGYRLYRRLL